MGRGWKKPRNSSSPGSTLRRLEEAQALHRRAVYAAERSAASAERAARFSMLTALIALAVVLIVVTLSPAWMARL
jgi:hypothetical protein